MKARLLYVAAAVLAGGMSPVFASGTATFDPITEIASFVGDPTFAGGTDTVTFSGLAAGSYDFTLTLSSQFIDNLSGDLNGQPLTIVNGGTITFGSLISNGTVPFELTLHGTPELGAAYSGQLGITSAGGPSGNVPEPASAALMLAGLGVAALKLRRRQGD